MGKKRNKQRKDKLKKETPLETGISRVLVLGKMKWSTGLTMSKLGDSNECLFIPTEGECNRAAPPRRWAAGPALRLPAFVPSQRTECQYRASLQLPLLKVGYGSVAPCLVGLCSFCFFLCKQRMKLRRPFQEGSQEDVSIFFLAGHKSDGNDMMIFRQKISHEHFVHKEAFSVLKTCPWNKKIN